VHADVLAQVRDGDLSLSIASAQLLESRVVEPESSYGEQTNFERVVWSVR
jgi:hypothetical protein